MEYVKFFCIDAEAKYRLCRTCLIRIFPLPDTPISISPDWLHKSGAKLLGTANSNSVDFVKATRLLSQKVVDVKPFISEVYELEDYQKAFESAVKGDKFRVIIKF